MPALCEPLRYAVRELDGHRHQLGRFVGGVPEHHSLIARASGIHALTDVGRLPVDGAHHRARLRVEAIGRIGVANALDGVANDFRKVDVGLGRDLAGYASQSGRNHRLAGDAGGRVLLQNGIEDGIGDLVGDLVRMTLGN